MLPTLLQLVAFDPDGEPSRRRVPLSELNERERDVAQAFIDARLLVSAQHEDDAVVEIAHEALLRVWQPLADSITASRSIESLAHRADVVARELARGGQRAIMLPTLLRLVAFDPDGEPSRRRVPLSELNERERDVAQGLIDARLLVSEQREDDVVVEIATRRSSAAGRR